MEWTGDWNDPTLWRTESTVGIDTALLKIKAEIPSLMEVCIPDEHSENSNRLLQKGKGNCQEHKATDRKQVSS